MAVDNQQHVVVIGGGAVGSTIAKSLVAQLNPSTHTLTLVTSRPYFINLPGMIRTAVTSSGSLEDVHLMPYADFLVAPKPHPSGSERFRGNVKVGKVVSFTSEEGGKGGGEVVLEGGEQVRYSVLIVATGNVWNGALHFPEGDYEATKAYLEEWRHKFEKAKSVVFVGGGAVGIEFAGEVKDFYPNTKVTIVHGDTQLLNSTYPDKFRRAALSRIEQTGTEVILDDLLEQTEPSADGTVKTKKGKVIEADLVVPTWGGRPNTSLLSASLGADVLTPTGHVKVQPTLQIQGYPRIFAAGDIIDWNEQKQAAKARGHSGVVTANTLTLLTGSGSGALKVYKGSPELIVITVGRSGGVCYFGFLWGLVFGDWLARLSKSKTLMSEMIRGQYGFGNYSAGTAKA